MKQKRMAAWTAAALCIGMLSVPASAAAGDFPQWATTAVEQWERCGKLEEGLAPDHVMTRGEMAAAIDRVMAYEGQAENVFTDLEDDDALAGPLLRLVEAGVLQGNGGGRILSGTPVTRQEAAVMVARAFDLAGERGGPYSDWDEIASWAQPAVTAVVETGLMTGYQGLFRPLDEITYAEVLQVLTAAAEREGLTTGLIVRLRSDEGVLAEGAPQQVNDGKFQVESVAETEEGYRIALVGLEALEGQEADADALGEPLAAGKWMGIQLQLGGLVRPDQLEYSRDGESWYSIKLNSALSETYRMDSVLLYVNGGEEAASDAQEVEKTSKLYLRRWSGEKALTITVHYTPADAEG